MEKNIAIISEGITDQIVLESILFAYLGEENITITRLQPKENESGNWDKVFKYCESMDLRQSLQFNDYVLIQIDTDFMHTQDVAEKYKINLQEKEVYEIINLFAEKIIYLIGKDFYQEYQNRFLFAIAVNEIECWFLPIYYTNQKSKAQKIKNCLNTLNKILPEKEGFYIEEKKLEYYEKISKHFKKKKNIEKYAKNNESFGIFIEEMSSKIII
jgi:hypothetical protein